MAKWWGIEIYDIGSEARFNDQRQHIHTLPIPNQQVKINGKFLFFFFAAITLPFLGPVAMLRRVLWSYYTHKLNINLFLFRRLSRNVSYYREREKERTKTAFFFYPALEVTDQLLWRSFSIRILLLLTNVYCMHVLMMMDKIMSPAQCACRRANTKYTQHHSQSWELFWDFCVLSISIIIFSQNRTVQKNWFHFYFSCVCSLLGWLFS